MTVEEIFSKMATHMAEGLTYHDEMTKAYDFLGLHGYAKCQAYHHYEETKNYRELSHYYATHYFKLLKIEPKVQIEIIPPTWYKYTSQAVDSGTKRGAVKELMEIWQKWEQETKQLYSQLYNELIKLGEVSAALQISNYLCDVDKELHNLQKKIIWLEAINYNLETILSEQSTMRSKYKKAIKKIF